MEAIGNILLYFYNNGYLPWMAAEDQENKKESYYANLKQSIPLDELCKDAPEPLKKYMHYVHGLKFEQKPDYAYCKSLFETYLKQTKFVLEEDNWDWDIQRESIILEKQRKAEEEKLAALAKKNKKKDVSKFALNHLEINAECE